MLLLMVLFGVGLPALAALAVAAMPITSDGTRSVVLWIFVPPAAIGGAILGALIAQTLGLG